MLVVELNMCNRVAASGIVDTIQLNVNDNTSSNMDFQTQLECLTAMKDTATEPSVYINKSRMMSSISNETLPLDHSFQHNHNVTTNIEQHNLGMMNYYHIMDVLM